MALILSMIAMFVVKYGVSSQTEVLNKCRLRFNIVVGYRKVSCYWIVCRRNMIRRTGRAYKKSYSSIPHASDKPRLRNISRKQGKKHDPTCCTNNSTTMMMVWRKSPHLGLGMHKSYTSPPALHLAAIVVQYGQGMANSWSNTAAIVRKWLKAWIEGGGSECS